MTLAHPERLWLLAVLPLLTLVAAAGGARRLRDWAALGQGGRPSRERSRLWLASLGALAVALAGPRWGRSAAPPLPPGRDVVIAVDVSRSMGALDAVPDRLGVAVESAESLVSAFAGSGGDRVAVVAFAGRGVLRCPLTANLGAAVQTLHTLRPGGVRPGGTDLGAGLDAALDAFDDQDRAGGRSVVIVSDGEDHAGRWRAAADRLRDRGVVAHAVAVGDDRQGHPVPGRADGPSEPLRYQGVEVLSRRSDEALSAIARATGGAFVPLGLATIDLGRLYRTRIEPAARDRVGAPEAPEPGERFAPFLLAALGLGLLACRPARLRPAPAGAWVFWFAVVLLATPGAAPRDDPAAVVAEGRAAYASGRYAEALDAFRRAERLAPASPVPRFDAGAALFQLGRYAEALAAYLDARTHARADSPLRTKIDFALGNTALALGDPAAAIGHYDDCLASTAAGAEADRVRQDAAANRLFAEEQVRRTPAPDDGGGDSPKEQPGDRGDDGKGSENQGSEPGGEGEGPPTESPSGRRGAGGAGGEGPAPPAPGSPEGRLARALENVREARDRRIVETTEPDASNGKDW